MLPQYRATMRLVSLVVETTYSWCLTLTSWLIVIGFWLHRKSMPSLFQQFCQLRPAHPSLWPHMARVMLVVLPITLNFLMFSMWYNTYRIHTYAPSGVYLVFLVSFSWLHVVQVMPFIYYLLFGQLILDSLVANNNALIHTLDEATGEMTLIVIHQKNVALRRLYGELEQVVSLPLLGCKIFITFIITDTLYFMVHPEGVSQFPVYDYYGILTNLLMLAGTGVACRMADNIRDQVLDVLKILL